MSGLSINDVFDPVINFPDPLAHERFSLLVGLDHYAERLQKQLSVKLNPDSLTRWANQHHQHLSDHIDRIIRHSSLIIFAGDVGSGKTVLAETIGDNVARRENIEISLYPLSLATRGQGRVGEMTNLLTYAINVVIEEAANLTSDTSKARGGIILLIDEADALAQSRESDQMHHEDRAGVNALIRGIDRLSARQLPVVAILCTNRPGALDPAISRRAMDIYTFARPNRDQRKAVLSEPLSQMGFSESDINSMVEITGEGEAADSCFTYSDLTQRVLPNIILDAYPRGPVCPERAIELVRKMKPTPAFREQFK